MSCWCRCRKKKDETAFSRRVGCGDEERANRAPLLQLYLLKLEFASLLLAKPCISDLCDTSTTNQIPPCRSFPWTPTLTLAQQLEDPVRGRRSLVSGRSTLGVRSDGRTSQTSHHAILAARRSFPKLGRKGEERWEKRNRANRRIGRRLVRQSTASHPDEAELIGSPTRLFVWRRAPPQLRD